VRLSVGKDAADATSRRQRKEAELNATNNGVAVVPENGNNGHRSVAAAIAEFFCQLFSRTATPTFLGKSQPHLCAAYLEKAFLTKSKREERHESKSGNSPRRTMPGHRKHAAQRNTEGEDCVKPQNYGCYCFY
jgi:hypothetical protein